jgi:hypothetical protein
MPTFVAGHLNNQIPQATPGIPVYAYGKFSYTTAATRMVVSNVKLLGNVAEIYVRVIAGNVPTTAQLLTVASDNSTFNVQNQPVQSVAIDATTGIGIIRYQVIAANVTSRPASGFANMPVAATADVFQNGSSIPVAIQQNTGPNNGRSINCTVTIPSLPTTGTVTAQTCTGDPTVDANYVTLGTVATVASGILTGGTSNNTVSAIFTDILTDFIRFTITGTTGGSSPTVIATVTV